MAWQPKGNIRGPQGDPGATGATGATGNPGTPGEKWASGAGAPGGTMSMAVGDWYLNTTNGDVFEQTSSGVWTLRANIKGPTGATGSQGPQGNPGTAGTPGAAGEVWFSGTGAPSGATGAIGDWYLNLTTGDVYEKTGSSTWTLRMNLKGPQGATGAQGSQGSQGPQGIQGPQGPAAPSTDISHTPSPGNPTGTASTSGKMVGLGRSPYNSFITAPPSGKIFAMIHGSVSNSIADAGAFIMLYYGSGTGPINGAAPVGTLANGAVLVKSGSGAGANGLPFAMQCALEGLTPGVSYWVDIVLSAYTVGTASVTGPTCTLFGLP